ncbi:hypothetical protein NDU88_002538 [Pleurodeles waltl]|uniref:Puratrophin-1 n=1 Tax=Pleurodeles waltl TaxID=8319 RepID=A0AAV7PAA4_PLEWA|nr:hypothetical protein NDU88_002538 [Pleurodeles waltl]
MQRDWTLAPAYRDQQSLDIIVQRVLSALYPPFDATAAIVLDQLFRIIEADYHGDGLRCLLDFLIPTKRQFERIQQAACAAYPGRLFVHEGWPLCLHEKVVVHIAPLSPFLLRPGDFYLHAKANGEQSVCVLLKCLSDNLRTLEEIPVLDSSYQVLFSDKWLEEVNRNRKEAPLHTCLVATEDGFAKVPWCSIVIPEFVEKSKPERDHIQATVLSQTDVLNIEEYNDIQQLKSKTRMTFSATDLQMTHVDFKGDVTNNMCYDYMNHVLRWKQDQGILKKALNHPSSTTNPILNDVLIQDQEGDYVDLLEIYEETQLESFDKAFGFCEIPASSIKMEELAEEIDISGRSTRGQSKPFPLVSGEFNANLAPERWTCWKPPETEKDACTPCLRRKLNLGSKLQGAGCRFRESYMAAIQNPVNFGPGQMTCISEDQNESKQNFSSSSSAHMDSQETISKIQQRKGQVASFSQFPGLTHKEVIQKTERRVNAKQGLVQLTRATENMGKRTALQDAPTGSNKFLFLKGQWQTTPTEGKQASTGSPQLSRLKPIGKDIDRSGAADLEVTLVQRVESKNGLWISVVGAPVKGPTQIEAIPNLIIPCQDLSAKVLYSGIACLPGSRDKHGKALIQVTTDSTAWEATWCTAIEVARLLLYLCSIPRMDVKSLGFLIIMDSRKKLPSPTLYAALRTVQVSSPSSMHTLLVLVEKEGAAHVDRIPGVQVEVLTSLKGLTRFIENGQLTWDLGGTFPYCHSEWVQFFQKLDPFVDDLKKAAESLQHSIQQLEQSNNLTDMQEPSHRITQYREMMKSVLSDTKLVNLQREGGATLARLRKEATHFSFSEDIRDAVESAVTLYNRVEELVHTLVTKSNRSLELLESLLKMRNLELEFCRVSSWIEGEGEGQLREFSNMEWSLENIEQSHRRFQDFFLLASAHYNHGLSLCDEVHKFKSSALLQMEDFKSLQSSFQAKLSTFYVSAERQRDELAAMLNLYRFCDKISGMTFDCNQFLAHLKPDESELSRPMMLQCIENYYQRFSVELTPEILQETKTQAYALSSCKGLAVWNDMWLRCQETKQMLEETLQKSRSSQWVDAPSCSKEEEKCSITYQNSGSLEVDEYPQCRTLTFQSSDNSSECKESNEEWRPTGMKPAESTIITCCNFGLRSDTKGTRVSQKVPRHGKDNQYKHLKKEGFLALSHKCVTNVDVRAKVLKREDLDNKEVMAQNSNNEALENLNTPAQTQPTSFPSCCPNNRRFPWPPLSRSHSDDSCSISATQGQSSRKVMQTSQNFHLSRHSSFSTEDTSSHCSLDDSSHGLPWARRISSEELQKESQETSYQDHANFAKLRRILEELLTTERDYVSSLGYVITHYIPEMERSDLPQGLRGQHPNLFGNLERLYEFHSQLFLQELNACWRDPLRVGRCFLRHKERFGLYAFYSKNKPLSDKLLVEHGTAFFKRKQQELGDKMDLSSYLLKPIQRISKYNLLLEDMLRECSFSRDKARSELHTAQDVIRFQLRHGNDLLAMEDIHDCDVNLKEQGQLLRQGELMVSYRKKKCFRRIFLFQDLILFSKTKKSIHGNEIYVYKQSFKTSEIGLTHTSGGSGLCFEIWFRRRKLQDTYMLQAPSLEAKEAWTTDLQKILWDQAITNREVRRQERIFSGLGCKPFTDIQPSDAAINDRAVHCALIGKGVKSSIFSAQESSSYHDSLFNQGAKCNDSGSSASSASSLGGKSSSSSGRGSLSPHGFLPHGSSELSRCFYGLHVCPEEGEATHEGDGPVFLTDSSGSSEGSVSGFSSSDPSCLSMIGREVDEASSLSTALRQIDQHSSPRLTPLVGRQEQSELRHPVKR